MHEETPIRITPEQDAQLDRMSDRMSYAQARQQLGILPLSREVEVVPEGAPPPRTLDTPPTKGSAPIHRKPLQYESPRIQRAADEAPAHIRAQMGRH